MRTGVGAMNVKDITGTKDGNIDLNYAEQLHWSWRLVLQTSTVEFDSQAPHHFGGVPLMERGSAF